MSKGCDFTSVTGGSCESSWAASSNSLRSALIELIRSIASKKSTRASQSNAFNSFFAKSPSSSVTKETWSMANSLAFAIGALTQFRNAHDPLRFVQSSVFLLWHRPLAVETLRANDSLKSMISARYADTDASVVLETSVTDGRKRRERGDKRHLSFRRRSSTRRLLAQVFVDPCSIFLKPLTEPI